MNCDQLFRIAIWVTKLLWITECQTCTMNIEDSEWYKQWYLNKSGTNEYDMNVMPAWRSCANGTGVTVGVVDKGIDDHLDLNIDRFLDAGIRSIFQYQNVQWTPRSSSEWRRFFRQRRLHRSYIDSLKHGTRVAGIIAAKKNNYGIIGIAFGAKIADIRIASTSVFDTFDTTLLRRPSNLIDVYSCSFANFHTGSITYPLLQNQESALEYGTQNGRGGLGSVYVFATGNSGGSDTSLFRDSCAYDRLVTNRYVIAVAGIQHDLQKLQNGEACSAMMVAAFTADANTEKNKTLITTDVRGTTTNHFYQNSAAAPMVSGAVALALSANPALSYRDIMHLLVNTSRSDLPDNLFRSNFFRNAAGFYVSSIFGFGLLDIGTLVERSKTWINVPRRQNCTEVKHLNRPINNNSTYFVVGIHSCPATYIEHVKISLKVNHDYAGKIQWVLISPHGTKSKVIPGRGLDSIKDMDITVLTVQMWGENPIGNWKLKPTPVFDASLDQGTVESVGLVIQGYRCIGQHCPLPAEEGDGIWSGWSIWSQCTVTCGQGTQRRKRQCNDQINARSCIGENSQISSCNTECLREIQTANATNECPSMVRERCVEQCSTDSDCSGRRKNKCCFNGCGHTCEISTTFWNEWSTWSQCTVTCGQGTKMRRRRCYPSHCTGEISETLHCYREECPRDEQSDCVDSYGYCRSPFHRICETRTQRYQAYYCRRTCGLCNF